MRKDDHHSHTSPYREICEKIVEYMSKHHIYGSKITDSQFCKSLQKLLPQTFLPITVNNLPGLNIEVCDIPCKGSNEKGYIGLNGVTNEKFPFGPMKVLYIQASKDDDKKRGITEEGEPAKLFSIMYHTEEKCFNFCIDNFQILGVKSKKQQGGVGG